jgi:alpha-methylacyl-CoA racemase
MPGPLAGLRVVEFGGIGPAPFCGMLLADMGAEVLLLERPGGTASPHDVTRRGKRVLALDLKAPEAVATALALLSRADALVEGFRPGVMERLGLGPAACQAGNPALVYGRMTGWGQDGPLAQSAGHDITYIALTGALAAMGRPDAPPAPPLNLVGDYGGGAMLLAFGVMAALWEAQRSGLGQVVDAAMVDGAALLTAPFHGMRAAGRWGLQRGSNLLDGGAPFYDCYPCADGKFVAVGPIEPQFLRILVERLELDASFAEGHRDPARWPALRAALTAVFATRSRDAWADLMEGSDGCLAPVLDMAEAPSHPHLAARGTFVTREGVVQPAAAPRFERSRAEAGGPPSAEPAAAILKDWGIA